MKKNENGFSIVEILVVIVVIGLIGSVGWLVMDRQKTITQNKKIAQAAEDKRNAEAAEQKQKEAVSYPTARWTYSTVEGTAAKKFIDKYNNAALSRGICNSKPVNMFDIHIKDYQAVFRYKCDNSPPTLIAIFEQDHSSPEDWDLKVSNMSDGKLPDWVYDRDIDFYKNSYGVVRGN
jgi:prepilin-type N-terminal cleavage/methylation domain-containing protein